MESQRETSSKPDRTVNASPAGEEQTPNTGNNKGGAMTKKAAMLMLAIKAMSAMKLTREDNIPSEIIPGLFLGSVGVAFNRDSLQNFGITHILTCADKLKPRFPDVS